MLHCLVWSGAARTQRSSVALCGVLARSRRRGSAVSGPERFFLASTVFRQAQPALRSAMPFRALLRSTPPFARAQRSSLTRPASAAGLNSSSSLARARRRRASPPAELAAGPRSGRSRSSLAHTRLRPVSVAGARVRQRLSLFAGPRSAGRRQLSGLLRSCRFCRPVLAPALA
jgi:hypothetical protein